MTSPRLQSGLSTIETILTLVILAIISGTGYYVWHSQQSTNKTFSETTKAAVQSASGASSTETMKNQTNADASQAIITDYKAGTIYSLDKLATTSDQQSQVGAIGRFCSRTVPNSEKDGSIVVTTDSNFFKANTSTSYTYDAKTKTATLNASCYNFARSQALPAPLHFIVTKQGGAWEIQNYNANPSKLN